jgi:alginate O-acetyltransferase complex protein AlgI
LAPQVLLGYWNVFVVLLFGMIVHWLPSSFKETYRSKFASLPIWVIALICFCSIFGIYQVLSADMHPFIYFQF